MRSFFGKYGVCKKDEERSRLNGQCVQPGKLCAIDAEHSLEQTIWGLIPSRPAQIINLFSINNHSQAS
jgi:hypothetical protein